MNYSSLFSSVISLFDEEFINTYKKINSRGKNRLIKYIISFYRRWYYSAMIENTVLSPANLLTWLNIDSGKPSGEFPLISTSSITRLYSIQPYMRIYSLDNHPILSDLKLLLESCMPDFELDDNDALTNRHKDDLLKKVSIFDPYYVDYLLLIAFRLHLVKKIPSIYSSRAQITLDSDAFFQLPPRECLDKIIHAATQISASYMNELVQSDSFVTPEFISSILKTPMLTDDIFKYFFSKLGFDIEAVLLNDDFRQYSDVQGMLLSGTFYLGIILDKYFFTPFGFYLRIINPGYILPMDMRKDLEYALDILDEGEDIDVAMFMPCSHYTLTDMGAQFFSMPFNGKFTLSAPRKIPIEVMIKFVLSKRESGTYIDKELLDYFVNDDTYKDSQIVYEIKVSLRSNRSYWKRIEILEATTLHELYVELCYEFFFAIHMNYRFYSDLTENAFSSYAPPGNKKYARMADTTTLKDLELSEKHKFMLVLYNVVSPFSGDETEKTVKLELEVCKAKEKKADAFYPNVLRESQLFKKIQLN